MFFLKFLLLLVTCCNYGGPLGFGLLDIPQSSPPSPLDYPGMAVPLNVPKLVSVHPPMDRIPTQGTVLPLMVPGSSTPVTLIRNLLQLTEDGWIGGRSQLSVTL